MFGMKASDDEQADECALAASNTSLLFQDQLPGEIASWAGGRPFRISQNPLRSTL
jgi:hypothetical protein